ncbi:nucleotidyltransferase domain-containing protein [Aureliella helgolandensis]|uniref:Putative nucleotidyltransferase n=1 Tax=Aureliella helgolandensis TaxID=2527968 RepID=A0A518GA26_9BACT|nr:nucleotidyltransferase domain-containing protein [Aureliella helgolandensis]QDV25444.1 putative nucleotidyltransferase [Aureliella helgolandensis]
MIDLNRLLQHVAAHPYPTIFVTISGAHLYGFPSPDSDFDLRGVHLLPLEQVIGLDHGQETVEKEGWYDGLEIDLVTHDAAKYFALMLKRNGYVLEQIFSPWVVFTTPEHEQIKSLAAQCITQQHAHHYLGFASRQWQLFRQGVPPRVKPLLYTYRVLLTGIHLMQTGRIEANLLALNRHEGLPYIDELVARKLSGPECQVLNTVDFQFDEGEYQRLTRKLEKAHEASFLPEQPAAKAELHNLLVKMRTGGSSTSARC